MFIHPLALLMIYSMCDINFNYMAPLFFSLETTSHNLLAFEDIPKSGFYPIYMKGRLSITINCFLLQCFGHQGKLKDIKTSRALQSLNDDVNYHKENDTQRNTLLSFFLVSHRRKYNVKRHRICVL